MNTFRSPRGPQQPTLAASLASGIGGNATRLLAVAIVYALLPVGQVAIAQQSELYRPSRQLPVMQQSASSAAPTDTEPAQSSAEEPAAEDVLPADGRRYASVALAPPQDAADAQETSPTSMRGLATTASSLAVVLAVFGLGVCVYRRYASPGGAAPQPAALQLLTRLPMGNRQSLALVRCGRRVLLVGLSPGGPRTLAEFSDADEVNRLVSSVGRGRDFHQTLTALAAGDHESEPFDLAEAPALAAMRRG